MKHRHEQYQPIRKASLQKAYMAEKWYIPPSLATHSALTSCEEQISAKNLSANLLILGFWFQSLNVDEICFGLVDFGLKFWIRSWE